MWEDPWEEVRMERGRGERGDEKGKILDKEGGGSSGPDTAKLEALRTAPTWLKGRVKRQVG